MAISGLGPHGERAAPPELLALSDSDAELARSKRFDIAVVLHTTASDWAKQQLAGIVATLGRYSAAVIDVADCGFKLEAQIDALDRLRANPPDAVISIPIGNTEVADAHRGLAAAGIKLVLMDNTPTGLLPGTDYACVVSADNFGLGQVAASLLAPHMPQGATVGILAYEVDFFVTSEREIAFIKWIESERPDLRIKHARFPIVEQAGDVTASFLAREGDVAGIFVVWDEPAMHAIAAMRRQAALLPMTTVDLGNKVAVELAKGDILKGIGAQQPYDQGVAVAKAAILSLIGRNPPPWVALPGLSVTAKNLVESYQMVWHAPAPAELIRARESGRRAPSAGPRVERG
jgi:ribose transport system substrate-binding protein